LKDGIPSYIQLFADGIAQYAEVNSQINDIKQIKELYNRITNKNYIAFENFHSRLTEYLGKVEMETAKKALAHLTDNPMPFEELYAYSQKLMPDRQHFHRLMGRLVDECYIKAENEIYDFVSPMLKTWWKNKYGWEKD
ncbi:hypothetical protein MUP95_04460, partial [bacterium]|nr:hypothetical protein [bacterium]